MKFSPKRDDELNTFEILPKGEYDFNIVKATNKVSKAGNEMIGLELDIFMPGGRKSRIFDYLLENVAYKLKHFCQAVGLAAEYESGALTADMCLNRAGRCNISIQTDKSGEYGDKNVVKDYCTSNKALDDITDVLPF